MSKIRITVKGAYLHRRMSEAFFNEFIRQLDKPLVRKFRTAYNIKKLRLMMFETFELYDMTEDGVAYYPLLYEYNGKEGFIWVCWRCLGDDGEYIGLGSGTIPDFVKFSICDNVPDRISKFVESLDIRMAVADTVPVRETVPYTVSQIFMYRFAEQISPFISKVIDVQSLYNDKYKIKITGDSYLGKSVYKDDVYSYTKARLLNKNGLSVDMWVRWRSLDKEKKYIEPDAAVIPFGKILFDIPAELPEGIKEEAGLGPDINPDFFSCLRKKLSRTGEKREKHGEYHFICDIDKNSFPLCRIQVFFDENITAEIENDIDMFYWTFVSEYNFSQSRGIRRHFIIDSSDITKSSENSLIIKADFGNCGRRVLHEFLQKLDDFYFNIEKVSVY